MQANHYTETAPTRAEVDATRGWLLLDFGTDWCGHCIAARPAVDGWMVSHREVHHLRVEDGRGRPLGRSFRVKLWPSLVLLRKNRGQSRLFSQGGHVPPFAFL